MSKKTDKIVELAGEKAKNKRHFALSAISLMREENVSINFSTVSKTANVRRKTSFFMARFF